MEMCRYDLTGKAWGEDVVGIAGKDLLSELRSA